MIRILLDQQHNTVIPVLLPREVKVAHKTGSIAPACTTIPGSFCSYPDGRKYVLVSTLQKPGKRYGRYYGDGKSIGNDLSVRIGPTIEITGR
jgi:hypothetical protein